MGHYIDTTAGPIHIRDYGGSGRTVLALHGLGGSVCNWDAVGPALIDWGHVVALDLPGFGVSPPGHDWSLSSHTRAVHATIAHLGGSATLIGNSMGGLLSEMVAAEDPGAVDALVLVSPATPPRLPDPRIHWPTARRLAIQATPLLGPAMTRHYMDSLSPSELVSFSLSTITHKPGRVPLVVVEELVRLARIRSSLPWATVAVPKTGRSIARYFRKPSRFVSMIRAIKAPTIVIQGIEDHIVSPTSVEWMCSLRPDWALVQMDDTGHTPQMDAVTRFLGVLTPWLETTLTAKSGAN